MILTGLAIHTAVMNGDIVIEPYNSDQLGSNSYDFKLGNRCKIYRDYILDSAHENPTIDITMDKDGMMLSPDRVYLFNTYEKMGSTKYVPIIRGRSSVGRLGIFIDITADLIDIGSVNQWTLQIRAVTPVRIYPEMLIGQVTFWVVTGEVDLYHGKYAKLQSPVSSLSYLDFRQDSEKKGYRERETKSNGDNTP
jgi:dCTP deaminase